MAQKSKVYCEPFCIKDGYDFEIHHVMYGEHDNYSCFTHFHEVHELIFFEKVEGTFYYHQGQSSLQDYDIVFTPAMETHDFSLKSKEKSWFIVQFSSKILESEGLKNGASIFQTGTHFRLDKKYIAQLQQIIKWSHESFVESPFSHKSLALLKLAIIILTEHSQPLKAHQVHIQNKNSNFDKIYPVVNLFRTQQVVDISLQQAADLCNLSASYFSRLFKNVFRQPFSEYIIHHKLYNAARILSQENTSITEISYSLNFSSPSHFITLFKKKFGQTPKKYRTATNSCNKVD
ncbi:AraC family transcriptional regulator [Agarilytica rhodophyticola]|uniref:AraC family transcriptional regulator n=1 Tax=Agarilytica rhodophyticola TaxID=1737490 RepID=UPI000B340EEF|nr:AraC family transcriptional regulator [Agarilytica rhodophyticola]